MSFDPSPPHEYESVRSFRRRNPYYGYEEKTARREQPTGPTAERVEEFRERAALARAERGPASPGDPNTSTFVGAFRETASMPMLEGASGVVVGIVAADIAASYAIRAVNANTTGLALLVRGVAKFAVAGLSIFLTSRTSGGVRVIGTTAALGSVASFVVDLLAASPFAKQLGLAAVKAFQISVPLPRASGLTVRAQRTGFRDAIESLFRQTPPAPAIGVPARPQFSNALRPFGVIGRP